MKQDIQTEQIIERIAQELQAPLMMREILEVAGQHQTGLKSEMEYALHTLYSEFDPDTALLSAAVSIRDILDHLPQSISLNVLGMEADRVLDEYASLWLEQSDDDNTDFLADILVNIPDDLNGISELIRVNMRLMEKANPQVARMARILEIQCAAQALVAETVLEVIEDTRAEQRKNAITTKDSTKDNVVQFPVN